MRRTAEGGQSCTRAVSYNGSQSPSQRRFPALTAHRSCSLACNALQDEGSEQLVSISIGKVVIGWRYAVSRSRHMAVQLKSEDAESLASPLPGASDAGCRSVQAVLRSHDGLGTGGSSERGTGIQIPELTWIVRLRSFGKEDSPL